VGDTPLSLYKGNLQLFRLEWVSKSLKASDSWALPNYLFFLHENSFFSFFFFRFYLFREGESKQMGGQRKGKESQADSPLIMEPDAGLDLMTLRS